MPPEHRPVQLCRARSGALGVLCLLVFFSTAGVLGRFAPPQYRVVRAKLEHFRAHRAEYDVIFLGTSRIYRAVAPAVFDAEMAAYGHPVRSFNFALPAMNTMEAAELATQLLEMEGPPLRWVFVELSLIPDIASKRRRTSRHTYWHTFRGTAFAVRYTWRSDLRLRQKVTRIRENGWWWLQRLTARGGLANMLRSVSGTDQMNDITSLATDVATYAGYMPLEQMHGPEYLRRHREFLEDVPTFVDWVARMQDSPVPEEPAPAYTALAIMRLIRVAEAHGTQLVFIVPPIGPGSRYSRLGAYPPLLLPPPPLLCYTNTVAYAQLYEPDMWFDSTHLNTRGGEALTALLARDVVEHLLRDAPR